MKNKVGWAIFATLLCIGGLVWWVNSHITRVVEEHIEEDI